MMASLQGKFAIVTGEGQGIGRSMRCCDQEEGERARVPKRVDYRSCGFVRPGAEVADWAMGAVGLPGHADAPTVEDE